MVCVRIHNPLNPQLMHPVETKSDVKDLASELMTY
jgi:hypothetical protein